MPGREFDLEAMLRRIDAKLDALDRKIEAALSRIDAKLELLHLDLLEPTLGADRLRAEHDAVLQAMRAEIDALRKRVEALEAVTEVASRARL
jgi:hypothetical protein